MDKRCVNLCGTGLCGCTCPKIDRDEESGYIRRNLWRGWSCTLVEVIPIEFAILSYLCCQHSHGGTNLSPEIIAKGIHMTVGTVKKYLSGLISKGLITDEHSPSPAFQCATDRKFFTLPNEIFLINLLPSTFVVYAYLLLIEDRKTHTCHPSCNTIAVETGITKNTATN